MIPWYTAGGVAIHVGHVLDVLAGLPAGSVQTCITSPPYWGLRAYDTDPQVWGGEPTCTHSLEETAPGKVLTGGTGTASAKQVSNAGSQYGNLWEETHPAGYRSSDTNPGPLQSAGNTNRERFGGHVCSACGAYYGELGSEPTPEQYVANIVAVFRAVRRVLRDDGTVFLNLGDSYVGGGGYAPNAPSNRAGSKQSTNAGSVKGRGRAYGTSDTAPLGSPGRGYPSSHLCGECLAVSPLHTAHSDSSHAPKQDDDSRAPNRGHMESAPAHLPSVDSLNRVEQSRSADAMQDQQRTLAPAAGQPHVSPGSTTGGYDPLLQETCSHCANCGVCLAVLRSSSRDGRLCARKMGDLSAQHSALPSTQGLQANMSGRDATGGASDYRKRGTVSGLAYPYSTITSRLKPKDLVGIPWRVAFALQADGWYLRSDIIWSKPNPMPESVTDRPTKAHEYLFLLSKRAEYYYDAEAIKESSVSDHPSGNGYKRDARLSYRDPHGARGNDEQWQVQSHRNRRSVWTIPTEAYPAAHFATFPRKLVEPCILAGTSARGQCPACGAPWRRVVERESSWPARKAAGGTAANVGVSATYQNGVHGDRVDHDLGGSSKTTGWEPTCACDAGDPVPQLVLDPFLGSGTTAYVARHHGRRAVGIELNESYARLAADRLRQGTLGLEIW